MRSTFVENTLPNGLRVICESMPNVSSAALAMFVRTGSRHEAPDQHGVSHFLEHMCFKGSHRRSCHDINVRFDELGSIYNAFTSKEHTVYYGWVPAQRAAEQLDLLADLVRPVLPPADYETERNVILEEIAMGDDAFERHVSNFLHKAIFPNHPLAHEILGEKETIEKLPREDMAAYLRNRYTPDNITLVATGAVDAQEIFAAAGRLCSGWQRASEGAAPLAAPAPLAAGVHKLVLKQFQQQEILLVFPAPGVGAADEEDIETFVSLFGGHNSRCYWNIVQKGLAAHAGVVWLAYEGVGAIVLYAAGEPDQCEQMVKALRGQAREIMKHGFKAEEVQRVKNQRRTQLALEGESPRTRLMQVIDDVESRGAPRTIANNLAAVSAVTPKSIQRFLRKWPIDGEGTIVSVGPRDWPR